MRPQKNFWPHKLNTVAVTGTRKACWDRCVLVLGLRHRRSCGCMLTFSIHPRVVSLSRQESIHPEYSISPGSGCKHEEINVVKQEEDGTVSVQVLPKMLENITL